METPIVPTVNGLAKIALTLLCALPWDPVSAEWRVIHNEPENFVEFDAGAVRSAPPLMLAWTRITYTKPQTGDSRSFQSQGQLHAVDCNARHSTVVGIVSYSGALGQGEAVERRTRPRAEWQPKPLPPGSLAELIVDLTCGARKPEP